MTTKQNATPAEKAAEILKELQRRNDKCRELNTKENPFYYCQRCGQTGCCRCEYANND